MWNCSDRGGLRPAADRRLALRLMLGGALALAPLLRARAQAPAPVTPEAEGMAAPAASAPAQARLLDLDWHDAARGRDVPVRLYLPLQASATPLRLVVVSHGIGGSRTGYRYLGQQFAAAGLASLHLQHVGSDRNLWLGNPFEVVSRLQGAATEAEATARVLDLRFALDRLQQQVDAGALGLAIDTRQVVAAGHSYGANTTLLAAGATVQRGGQALALRDPRVAAAIVLSAPPFYGEATPRNILGAVQVPTLHVTTTEDVIRIPGYQSGLDDRLAVFDAVGSRAKWLAVFKQGNHSIFVGRRGEGHPVVAATRDLALAFVQQALGLPGGDLDGWRAGHQGLLARWSAVA